MSQPNKTFWKGKAHSHKAISHLISLMLVVLVLCGAFLFLLKTHFLFIFWPSSPTAVPTLKFYTTLCYFGWIHHMILLYKTFFWLNYKNNPRLEDSTLNLFIFAFHDWSLFQMNFRYIYGPKSVCLFVLFMWTNLVLDFFFSFSTTTIQSWGIWTFHI